MDNDAKNFPFLQWMRDNNVTETLENYIEIAGLDQDTVNNWTDDDTDEYGAIIPPHLLPKP